MDTSGRLEKEKLKVPVQLMAMGVWKCPGCGGRQEDGDTDFLRALGRGDELEWMCRTCDTRVLLVKFKLPEKNMVMPATVMPDKKTLRNIQKRSRRANR